MYTAVYMIILLRMYRTYGVGKYFWNENDLRFIRISEIILQYYLYYCYLRNNHTRNEKLKFKKKKKTMKRKTNKRCVELETMFYPISNWRMTRSTLE